MKPLLEITSTNAPRFMVHREPPLVRGGTPTNEAPPPWNRGGIGAFVAQAHDALANGHAVFLVVPSSEDDARPAEARWSSPPDHEDHRATIDRERSALDELTQREREVIALLAREGLRNRELAARLRISEKTVRHHLSAIFSKLDVDDRCKLIVFAYRHGLETAAA